jgi:catechol 2,3-dioxygenase-like lactoylglutathione lyase family enzyme
MNARQRCTGVTRSAVLVLVSALGCGTSGDDEGEAPAPTTSPQMQRTDSARDILATNAFFYYADVEAATRFYTDTLGIEIAADYGFAKILRVAEASYLTLVDAERGMHSADEPKTVAIALVTDELEQWYEYLRSTDVEFRNELSVEAGKPHDGFVVYDPEGYYLEFERFNDHEENRLFTPVLERARTFPTSVETGGGERLGFKATVLWMYYRDLDRMQRFYEDVLGEEMIVDQGWTKIYPASSTGFLGLVDETRGMHSFTEDKGVTISLFTSNVDSWFGYMDGIDGFEFRTREMLNESDKVRVFVGYDPENYFVEWDTFVPAEGNEKLLEQLAALAAE